MEVDVKEWERYKKKIEDVHEFIFAEGLDGRTAENDMRLVRLLIHRFSSAKFFIGVVVGLLTVGIPAVYGLIKLLDLIRTYLKAG